MKRLLLKLLVGYLDSLEIDEYSEKLLKRIQDIIKEKFDIDIDLVQYNDEILVAAEEVADEVLKVKIDLNDDGKIGVE